MRRRAHLTRSRRLGSSCRPMCAEAIAASMLGMNSPPPHDSPAIETRGLGKSFGSRAALEHVDLVVPRRVAFGFLAAAGAGKTTVIRLLLALAEPTPGRMRGLGHDRPWGRAEALARVGAI